MGLGQIARSLSVGYKSFMIPPPLLHLPCQQCPDRGSIDWTRREPLPQFRHCIKCHWCPTSHEDPHRLGEGGVESFSRKEKQTLFSIANRSTVAELMRARDQTKCCRRKGQSYTRGAVQVIGVYGRGSVYHTISFEGTHILPRSISRRWTKY